MPDPHVDHAVLAAHAQNKVNIPADEARKRRRQVNHLRARLEDHIDAHPGYDLVKLRGSGSTAKHTAIRRRRRRGIGRRCRGVCPRVQRRRDRCR